LFQIPGGSSHQHPSALKQQKRPIAKPLSEISAQHKDCKTAIIAAYKTGAYSQREVGAFLSIASNGGWGYCS
jgi:hypothetical protein